VVIKHDQGAFDAKVKCEWKKREPLVAKLYESQ